MTDDGVDPAAPGADGQVPAPGVAARVSGVSGGQIAVGNRVIQISAAHGSVVVAGDEAPLEVSARPTPVLRGLRPPRRIIGREQELVRIQAALDQGLSVEVTGPPGVGKTTVLSALSVQALPVSAPAGIVAPPAGLPVEDILQFVFDAFWERNRRVKPTPEELLRYMRDVRVLVVLDDPDLDRRETERILESLPSAVFAIGLPEPLLIGADTPITLHGLPRDDAVALLAATLGRGLAGDEAAAAGRLVDGLDGIPLQLLQLGAVVQDRGISLVTLVDDVVPTVEDPQAALQEAATATLGVRERAVLVAVAAFGGVAVGTGLVAKYAGEPDAGSILRRLVGRGLAKGDDLTGWAPIDPTVAGDDDRAGAAPVLVEWILDEGRQPEEVGDQSPVVLAVARQEQTAGRFDEVIRLAAVAEGMLALAGSWGAWRSVLESGLGAASAISDRASAAFFEHQLDVRSGTLRQVSSAQQHLAQAMRDPDTLYRDELTAIHPAVPGEGSEGEGGSPGSGVRWPLIAGIGLVVLAVVGVLILVFSSQDETAEGQRTTPGGTASDTAGPTGPRTPPPAPVDVSVDVVPPREALVLGERGSVTVEVANTGGSAVSGSVTISASGAKLLDACGQQGSTQVFCDAVDLGEDESVPIGVLVIPGASGSVEVTAEFLSDDEGFSAADSATIPVTSEPAPPPPPGGPATPETQIEQNPASDSADIL